MSDSLEDYQNRMVVEFMTIVKNMPVIDHFDEADFEQLQTEVSSLVSRVSNDVILHCAHLIEHMK